MTIFEHDDYLEILNSYFQMENQRSGLKSAFAKGVGIQTSYLSQIMSGKTNLSVEQALKATKFLRLNKLESDYFMLAVQKAKAGSKDLVDYFQKKMTEIQKQKSDVKKRISKTDVISDEATRVYYSSWIYSAVHVALSLDKINTPEDLVKNLSVPLERINHILSFLMEEKIIERTDLGFTTVPTTHIHLPNNSPMIQKHHQNWRLRAIEAIENQQPENLHYSVNFSIAKKDVEKIRENLLKAIKQNVDVVVPSKEEEIHCVNIDFFQLA